VNLKNWWTLNTKQYLEIKNRVYFYNQTFLVFRKCRQTNFHSALKWMTTFLQFFSRHYQRKCCCLSLDKAFNPTTKEKAQVVIDWFVFSLMAKSKYLLFCESGVFFQSVSNAISKANVTYWICQTRNKKYVSKREKRKRKEKWSKSFFAWRYFKEPKLNVKH
jgi:hypothetical protein